MDPVRVVIADEHKPIAEGLKGLLEPEFEVTGVVSSGCELLAVAASQRPDVIVTAMSLPGLDGIDVIRQLRREGNPARVVVLGMNTDVAYAARSLEAGASSYLPKHMVSGEIVAAIRTALDDRVYVSSKMDGELPLNLVASSSS